MGGIEPFQFQPIYQPGEEPPQDESVVQEAELEELNQKFDNSGLYLLCDYSHEYFV